MMAMFEIINATDSLIQSICMDSLPLLTYLLYFSMKTPETILNYAHQFIKITLLFHRPYLSNEDGDPQFLFHL